MGRWFRKLQRDAKRRNPRPRTSLSARINTLEVMLYEANSYLISNLHRERAREGGGEGSEEEAAQAAEARRKREEDFLEAAEEYRRHLSALESL